MRVFENDDIIHVAGKVDPIRDMETIAIELQLADMQNVDKRLESVSKQAKTGDREFVIKKQVLDKYKVALEKGEMASTVALSDEEKSSSKDIQLLTTKPFLFIANSEFNLTTKQFNNITINSEPSFSPILIDAKLESELAELTDEERAEYLRELGLPESGLEKIIKQRGLENRVFLAGQISDAYKYLKACDIFVLPSAKEGFPWTILEAMLAGLPIIATKVGAIPEILENGVNGWIVESENQKQIVEKILWFSAHPDDRHSFGISAKQRAKNQFALNTMLSKYRQLFRAIIDKKTNFIDFD